MKIYGFKHIFQKTKTTEQEELNVQLKNFGAVPWCPSG